MNQLPPLVFPLVFPLIIDEKSVPVTMVPPPLDYISLSGRVTGCFIRRPHYPKFETQFIHPADRSSLSYYYRAIWRGISLYSSGGEITLQAHLQSTILPSSSTWRLRRPYCMPPVLGDSADSPRSRVPPHKRITSFLFWSIFCQFSPVSCLASHLVARGLHKTMDFSLISSFLSNF